MLCGGLIDNKGKLFKINIFGKEKQHGRSEFLFMTTKFRMETDHKHISIFKVKYL
jgi:hypothetical protein